MYPFKLKPAAKSSTSILVSAPGAVACPRCGCRDINKADAHRRTAITNKPGCKCICHRPEEVA